MAEEATNPIRKKQQEPTDEEIIELLAKAEPEKAKGTADKRDFITGTATPDKEG